MYCKLVNGQIQILKMPIDIGAEQIFTNDEEIIRSYGYKPIRYTNPEEREGFYASGFSWDETDTEIAQEWQYTEIIDD